MLGLVTKMSSIIKRVLKSKKVVALVADPEPVKRVLKSKKEVSEPEPVKRVLKSKKEVLQPVKRVLKAALPIPPPPAPGVHITKAMEAFEILREYYQLTGGKITQADIKWYHAELAEEKKEFDAFWERCAVTKAIMECVVRGDDEWTMALAENAARQKVKALPITQGDIGPMPEYGSKEFWAWCHKRKKLKLQKEEEKRLEKEAKKK